MRATRRPSGADHKPGETESSLSARLAVSHDASHFLMVPKRTISVKSSEEVAALLTEHSRLGKPLTFRSGGTSLSGQGVTDQLLVDTRRFFRGVDVLGEGERVRVGPGSTVRSVNMRLAPYGYRFGPDPASEIAATIGGVVANNSSGMICGTEENAYRTLESLIAVLASGTVVNTGRTNADDFLMHSEPELHAGLIRLRDRVRSSAESVQAIRRLFQIKNTMGYAVNAFLDFDSPIDILAHLLVGSEGTLAFVAEATFRTVPLRSYAATGLLIFDSMSTATECLPALVQSGLAAIELLDSTALRVAQRYQGDRSGVPRFTADSHAALLIEFQEMAEDELCARLETSRELLEGLPLTFPAALTTQPTTRADLWHTRKGLFASVAAERPRGTSALLEDIAVPMPMLAKTCADLSSLFHQHDYDKSVIFGHAKDGNIHFLISERFDDAESLQRFSRFTDDLVAMVLGAGGTLKAEHGTGRMMAPFVRNQFGDELYSVMREIKNLFDPRGILNPGVIISDDPTIHLQHLKTSPAIEEEADRCVDCGYCEAVCPSRDLSLTPRQRIGLQREIARASLTGNHVLAKSLTKESVYSMQETCAVDGMCATACPLGIDTGSLVKRLRSESAPLARRRSWELAAQHWAVVTRLVARSLTLARMFPKASLKLSRLARVILGAEDVPLWSIELPRGGHRRSPVLAKDPVAVYMPACVGSMFGPEEGFPGVSAALMALIQKAGVEVLVPPGVESMCCGTPFSSKGVTSGLEVTQEKVLSWLWQSTDSGRLPVVVDASSCTEGLRRLVDSGRSANGGQFRVIDAITFTHDVLLPRLPKTTRLPRLALHPTCSIVHLDIMEELMTIAGTLAENVLVPDDWGCCGFAGDRGLLHPELTAAAVAPQVKQIRTWAAPAHASVNRTCELGMSRASGHKYVHVLEHLAVSLKLFPALPTSTVNKKREHQS